MSPIATYSFLPWLRQGVATTIAAADGDSSVKTRATAHVELRLSGAPVGGGADLTQSLAQDIALYGPGDIVGIDARAIVRTEPRNWITNFEGNYLPAIDFYDEDFPWRYTPAAPGAGHLRLRPWIALVVLEESEFAEGTNVLGRPLPYITIKDPKVLPPADELWAWAHVHFNSPLGATPTEVVSSDMNAVLARAQSIVAHDPDAAYARLLCPRRLDDNSAYHAFVIPTFETGRLAGLGLDPSAAPFATASAWAPYAGRAQGGEYPIYHRWYFRTGSHGDFEYLVRQLKPQPVAPKVGTRDIDVRDPGSNLPPILDPALAGVLRLGGALRVPDADLDPAELAERQRYEHWDEPYPHPFERSLAAFVDLPDDYAAQDAQTANAASGLGPAVTGDPDPLITAPLYGRWHALTQRLLTARDGTQVPNDRNWVHRLNLDPGFRVPAAFGADVVENRAEEYMNDAWQQIGDVLAANMRIRRLHLATQVSLRWYDRHLTPLAAAQPERVLALTAPVQARVLGSTETVATRRAASLVPPVLTSTAMRRVLRPQGRLMRSLPFGAAVSPANLLARVNAGEVSAAPPKTVPPGVVTVDEVAAAAPAAVGAPLADVHAPDSGPPWALMRLPWALIALAVVLVVALATVVSLWLGLAAVAVILVLLAARARPSLRRRAAAAPVSSIGEAGQTKARAAALPHNPGFVLSEPGGEGGTPTGATDSETAKRFKHALGDSFGLLDGSKAVGAAPEPEPLDLQGVTETVVTAVDPAGTVVRRGFSTIDIPDWVAANLVEDYGEVMAYPKIDLPMYEPLKAISIELFLPNIDLIPPNSITLVETNQKFIESYLVGLNHEFARKLLWREYPTDQRGSYFRQFWDVRSAIDTEGLSHDALKEKLYDIPELHRWAPASALGDHNNRQGPAEHGEQAVLVIRGELLKKYPTAVIYAHRAQWEYAPDGHTPDLTKPRTLVALTPAEEQTPPRAKMRLPLYEAKAEPDIYFFGFDLTIPEAKGGSGQPPDDDPGWFFVVKERPGEPRFGLELSPQPQAEVVDELTWDDAAPGGAPGQFLPATSLASIPLAAPPSGDPEGKLPQHDDDVTAAAAPASSARWAYLLFRPPVMVAVHADEMLGAQS